jgi:hypothetical protein
MPQQENAHAGEKNFSSLTISFFDQLLADSAGGRRKCCIAAKSQFLCRELSAGALAGQSRLSADLGEITP